MSPKSRAVIIIAFGALGVAFVFASLSVGWWSISTDVNPWTIAGHEYHFEATSTFLPGPSYNLRCTVNDSSMPGFGYVCSVTGQSGILQPYSPGDPNTAPLFEDLVPLIWTAAIIALGGLAMLTAHFVLSRRNRRTPLRFGWVVLLVAAALTLAGPIVVLLSLPPALLKDHMGSSSAVTSFWGSCQSVSDPNVCGINATQSWGAGPGWYLSVGAGALLIVAGAMSWKETIRKVAA